MSAPAAAEGTDRSWDDLLADPSFHWEEPDPGVVVAAAQWQRHGRHTVYDLGCGAGRHLLHLSSLGLLTVGSDLSPNGLTLSAARLRSADLPVLLVQAHMSAAPFRDRSFDAALAINVLNHGDRSHLQQAADEVWRLLRPGGEFYLTVLNTQDWRYRSGEQVEADSFVLAEGPETGILHHFFSEQDLLQWLARFEVVSVERERGELKLSTRPGGAPVVRDAWAVLARRPGGFSCPRLPHRGTSNFRRADSGS